MTARVIMVAGSASGTGKTTVTAGLIRAWRRRGLAVRPAKAGPDYIDPAFHAAAAGVACVNLDSWAMGGDLLDAILAEAAANADLVVIEAAMGLFDGLSGPPGRTGAAADLAARYRLPVLLVLDVGGQSQTAAAVARGLAAHDLNVHVAGVILNRVASERHRSFVAEAMARVPIALFGALGRDERLAFPSRHLGLVQAGEHADLDARIDRLADAVEAAVDLDAVLAAAVPLRLAAEMRSPLPPPGMRIALAEDAAFSFVYPHVVAGWRRAGAGIRLFSPLADEPPPANCDSCWLPGGYPELHAGSLAAAERFRVGLTEFSRTRPVHGECGGYMVLGEWLEDAAGVRHRMTGLLGHGTSFAERRLTLGYREARLLGGSVLGDAGALIRGHEFHYSTLKQPGNDAPLAEVFDGQGRGIGKAGGCRGNVSGTYFHAIASVQSG
jgi:cobyrinic acid a,c-diamide synthase